MLLALLGMAGVGWLAGESIRRGRRLGQRGLPGPMPPPPGESFTRCQKLLSEIDQTLDRALKNYEKARELSDQAKAIQLELGAHPGWRTGPGFEALKRRFEEMQGLMRDAQAHQNAGEALERGWRDLWDQYRRECEPQPQGMLMPQGRLAPSQMTASVSMPFGEQGFAPLAIPSSMPGMLAPAALPKGGSPVGLPSIATTQEAAAVPVRSPVASVRRPGISVPLPVGGGVPIAFTGTLSGFGLGQRGGYLLPPRPQPFTEAPSWPVVPTFLGLLLLKLNEAHADLARYQPELAQAERRFDALEQANAPAETLREAGAVAQDLSARVEDAEQRIERYEGEIEDLSAAGEEPPAPPPVYQGVPIPPFVPPLPWPKSLPQEREPIVTAPFRAASMAPISLAPSGMPRPGSVGPTVSVATETARLPTPSAPARRTVSVPFAPSGGAMTFTGV